MLWKAVRVTEQ